jgi:RNA polymerase sigma factor (sigma-70 family)
LDKTNNSDNNDRINEIEFGYVRKVLEGDTHSFQYLQQKYYKLILNLIRKMIKEEDDVEDLAQESFIKAYRALSSFQFGFSFSAWLYRIASNTCIDFLRKKRFPTISLSQTVAGNDEEYEIEIGDQTYVPDLNVMNEERRIALYKAIDSLPENYRIIIKLRHEDELDYKDISERLDMPLGTVKAHLFRARKILYDALSKNKGLFSDL